MQNIVSSQQMRQADEYTIQKQNLTPTDLMERASKAFCDVFVKRFPDVNQSISVFCGTGNNGGDGLCIARILLDRGYTKLAAYIFRYNPKSTKEFDINYKRLKELAIPVFEITASADFPEIRSEIAIDAMLGSGLNRPLDGYWLKLINYLNEQNGAKISVDVPSGFLTEGDFNPDATFYNSQLVITFQRPKINFFLPDAGGAIGEVLVVDIGLDEDFIQNQQSDFGLINEVDVRKILKPRKQFSHKGTFGHALIVAGSEKTMGAALFCCDACVRTGAGLTTACIPKSGNTALNIRLPEAMILNQEVEVKDFSGYNSIGIGPGLGNSKHSQSLLEEVLNLRDKMFVLDADALNILAENKNLLSKIPKEKCVITPHMKEFDRMFGDHKTWWQRLQTAITKSKELDVVIVLKNRYTFIILPEQPIFINSTGSPAMATGGTGDVLTGMITSLLAQGYSRQDAALLGVFIHGKCGQQKKQVVIPASDLLREIPGIIGELLN